MGKYIGIDLGTTFSVVSYIDDSGNPQIVNNAEGENITPSSVLFEDGAVIVGSDAKSASIANPDSYVAFAKRNMGSSLQKYNIGGNTYTPEDISALILKKLVKDTEAALNDEVLGAVITVPAYFTDPRRQATIDAAAIAGLPVLEIINEPTAAAMAYGINSGDEEEKNVLVYDLGGGTFDISIMRFCKNDIEVLTSRGDSELGGYDFDLKIIEWFKAQAKQQGADVDSDLLAQQNLLLEAEKAKKSLSSGRTKVMITLNVSGKPVRAELTKENFENMIDPLIYQTICIMNAAMDEAKLEYADLHKILLVGGSTRIPLVKSMILEETGIEPSMDIHPDEAVAKGAAFHAVACALKKAAKKREECSNDNYSDKSADAAESASVVIDESSIPEVDNEYSFIDRTSHGIGVEAYNDEGIIENSVILPKNSVVPAEAFCDYQTTADYQESLKITVRQGEDKKLEYTTIIGETELKLRPKPIGSPIRVVISCDINSIIHVSVIDLTDNEDLGEMKIERVSNLSKEEVQKAQNKLGKLNIGWE